MGVEAGSKKASGCGGALGVKKPLTFMLGLLCLRGGNSGLQLEPTPPPNTTSLRCQTTTVWRLRFSKAWNHTLNCWHARAYTYAQTRTLGLRT